MVHFSTTMASRDQDEMLRELRHTTGLVLVRRRGVSSRRGRASLWRDRRGSPGAPWRDKGSPKMERSTAKGKRCRKQKGSLEDEDSILPRRHSDQLSLPPRCPHPAQQCHCHLPHLPLSSPPSSRCSSTSSLASIGGQETQQPSVVQACTGHVDDGFTAEFSLPGNFPAAHSASKRHRYPDSDTSPQLTPHTWPGAGARVGCSSSSSQSDFRKEDERFTVHKTEHKTSLKQKCRHFRQCADPEVNYTSDGKTLWLNGGVQHSAVSSCSCSESESERAEREECDNVCDSQDEVSGVKHYCGQRTFLASTALTELAKGDHLVRPVTHAAVESCYRPNSDQELGFGQTLSSRLHNSDQQLGLGHTLSSCLHCQQQRFSPLPCAAADGAQQEADACPSGDASTSRCWPAHRDIVRPQWRQVLTSDSAAAEDGPGPCAVRVKKWSRMWRLRYVGRCLLLLLLTGCCGLLAHVIVTDNHDMAGQHGGGDIMGGAFGVGLGPGGLLPVNTIMKMHMRPVPSREFHARLRTIRNKFDFLRIFLADRDMSDASLRDLFTSAIVTLSSGTSFQADVNDNSQTSASTPQSVTSLAAHSDTIDSGDVSAKEGHLLRLVRLVDSTDGQTEQTTDTDGSNKDVIVSTLDDTSHSSDISKGHHVSQGSSVLSPLNTPLQTADSADSELDSTEVSKDSGLHSKLQKRADTSYEDYEEEDANTEDYFDGEVEYYNDERHADALMEELEAAVYHMTEMENSPEAQCKDPQPQVLHVQDPQKLNRQFYPECTVVHRCRKDSGCCGKNYECGPKSEQVIMRMFLVINVDTASDTVLPDSQIVQRIALVNHTECQCREKKRLLECSGQCPGVFRMYRYGWQCVCDCVSSPNERFPQCDGVKDGLYPLSQDDLVCIKSGKCGPPKCSVGTFDVSSGLCPLKDAPRNLHSRLHQRHQQRHRRVQAGTEGSGDF